MMYRRRAFTPVSLGPHCLFWTSDAHRTSLRTVAGAVAAVGDAVHTRRDLSLYGNHFTALGPSYRPILTANVYNGLAACAFNMVHGHQCPSIAPLSSTKKLDLWAVMQNDATTTVRYGMGVSVEDWDASPTTRFLVYNDTSLITGVWYTQGDVGLNTIIKAPGNPFLPSLSLYRFTVDRTTGSGVGQTEMYWNGVPTTSGFGGVTDNNTNFFAAATFNVGYGAQATFGGSTGWVGNIVAVALFDDLVDNIQANASDRLYEHFYGECGL